MVSDELRVKYFAEYAGSRDFAFHGSSCNLFKLLTPVMK